MMDPKKKAIYEPIIRLLRIIKNDRYNGYHGEAIQVTDELVSAIKDVEEFVNKKTSK